MNLQIPHFTRVIILGAVGLFLFTMCGIGGVSCDFFSATEVKLFSLLPKLLIIGFLFLFSKLVTSSIKLIITRKEGKRSPFSPLNIIRYGVWVVFVVFSATIAFGDIGAILTSLGLIGFGITFALQKPILNFVGWLNINFHKTYEVGDRIEIGKVRGDVQEIQVMHTIIKGLLDGSDTRSGRIISVPNELTLTEPVQNYTKESNFLTDELHIGITYESDWRKAKNILETIVNDTTKKNLSRMQTNLNKRISFIDATIDKLSSRVARSKTKEREEKIKDTITSLQEQKQTLAESVQEIPQQFQPKIHVEMAESSIVLAAQFMCPYDMKRQIKTEINSAFLDAIRREHNVQIAYPHLELIMNRTGGGIAQGNLSDFLQIKSIDFEKKN